MDERLLVSSVAHLLQKSACRQCLAWCKADAVIEQLHVQLPGQLLGYVAMPAEAGRPSMAALRLSFPQVLL